MFLFPETPAFHANFELCILCGDLVVKSKNSALHNS
jgi:hypothetical protein